jgi:hypothetical protein
MKEAISEAKLRGSKLTTARGRFFYRRGGTRARHYVAWGGWVAKRRLARVVEAAVQWSSLAALATPSRLLRSPVAPGSHGSRGSSSMVRPPPPSPKLHPMSCVSSASTSSLSSPRCWACGPHMPPLLPGRGACRSAKTCDAKLPDDCEQPHQHVRRGQPSGVHLTDRGIARAAGRSRGERLPSPTLQTLQEPILLLPCGLLSRWRRFKTTNPTRFRVRPVRTRAACFHVRAALSPQHPALSSTGGGGGSLSLTMVRFCRLRARACECSGLRSPPAPPNRCASASEVKDRLLPLYHLDRLRRMFRLSTLYASVVLIASPVTQPTRVGLS